MDKRKSQAKPQPDESKTMPIAKAGQIYFGLGRDASYEAARSGKIPAIKIGNQVRALVPAIERMLAEGMTKPAA